MQAKLTLSLDRDVIEHAKEFSRSHRKSLSKMVENYLRLVVGRQDTSDDIDSVVAGLMGAAAAPLGVADRGRDEYTTYLEEKYR